MKINEATFKAMPPELRALFTKLPNPGSDEVVGLFPADRPGSHAQVSTHSSNAWFGGGVNSGAGYGDSGSAARFFYCAKCSKKDRNAGLGDSENGPQTNGHPTVKPTDLMRYLCRLVTPPGGTVLDPFMGSGSTGKAAMKEGFNFIGIEMDEAYVEIAKLRIAHACLPEFPKETKKKGAK
jgi:site-specific DNA-methyltransferase (adenine-specific)